jgi:hypothetical protein
MMKCKEFINQLCIFQALNNEFGTLNYIYTDIFMMLAKGKGWRDSILKYEDSKMF